MTKSVMQRMSVLLRWRSSELLAGLWDFVLISMLLKVVLPRRSV